MARWTPQDPSRRPTASMCDAQIVDALVTVPVKIPSVPGTHLELKNDNPGIHPHHAKAQPA